MINTALYFLHKVAIKLPHNQFATAFYNQLKKAGDAVDVDGLDFLEIAFEEGAELEGMDYSKIERDQDFRFLYLYLKSFRKFPSIQNDNEYFGVVFSEEEKKSVIPVSTLLQGGNGTGKTSIFGAMEYLFTGNMSAAMEQGYTQIDTLEQYLPYANGRLSDVDINVVTHSLHFSLGPDGRHQKNLLPLCLLPFFCSEYDVHRLIENGLDKFVYEQMGYTSVIGIIQNMEKEIDEAVSRHDTLNYTLDNVVSQIAELDKKIGIYERLKPSFLSLVINVSNRSKPNRLLSQCKRLLSNDIVLEEAEDNFQNTRHLILKSIQNEMDFFCRIFGKNAQSHYLMQLYTKVGQFIQTDAKKEDPLLAFQLSSRGNLLEAVEELNVTRLYFHQIISELFSEVSSSDLVSDVVHYAKKLENCIQDLKNERQQEEEKKEKLGKNQRFVTNKEVYDEFLTVMKSEVYKTVKIITEGARNMLNEIMDLFIMEDEEMLFNYDDRDGTFHMSITLRTFENSTYEPLSPEKYLNTFRYKLYCMTLKIAIAFAMKKFYKMNFPIVIDDLFYSSDFEHREMVRLFFRILFFKHRELFSNDLQVIFLSHDEVVLEAAYRGICDIVTCTQVNRQTMFDYRDVDETLIIKMPIITEEQEPILINMQKLTCS